MSGALNRAVYSMDNPPGSELRNIGGTRRKTSPHSALRQFRQVKEEINQIFVQISDYIDDCLQFLTNESNSHNSGSGDVAFQNVIDNCLERIIQPETYTLVADFKMKVKGIREVISRNHMKCAFFGRTSNGKSTVVNAMLGNKLLPSGIGHTTNCFLQVEGTNQDTGFVLLPGSTEHQTVDNLRALGSALSDVKLECDSVIKIYWPKKRCALLKEDVVLLDSPGIDVSPDLDTWIDQFCLDADVFILVCNAESTLMQTEKNFFFKVSERLSKPNIFILNNRWDCSDFEEESVDLVKKQHLERTTKFLVDELKVCSRQEVENRVYFVSAKEALINRMRDASSGTDSPVSSLADGWNLRYLDFNNFEREFELILSESAIKTKFASHTDQGRSIIMKLFRCMEAVYENSLEEKDKVMRRRQQLQSQLEELRLKVTKCSASTDRDIRQTLEGIERKVVHTLSEEIRRLVEIVDDFDRPFHPDTMMLVVYKKELNEHVERALGKRLVSSCSRELSKEVARGLKVMLDRFCSLVGDDAKSAMRRQVQPGVNNWEPAFHVDCRNICADFREDITFRFSLGPMALLAKLQGRSTSSNSETHWQAHTPHTPSNSDQKKSPPGMMNTSNSVDSSSGLSPLLSQFPLLLSAFPSLMSRNTVGAVAVIGVVFKATGWRVLAVCGAIYSGVYLYERLSFTTRARERLFKRQYVDYASAKLRLIVDLTSANACHQVKQELTAAHRKLMREIEMEESAKREEAERLDILLSKLEETCSQAKRLKNQANFLDKLLGEFYRTKIQQNRLTD